MEQLERNQLAPTGWLVDPEKKRIIFFIKDPTSLMRLPKVITQLWYASDGIPIEIKHSRKIDLDGAIETWNE